MSTIYSGFTSGTAEKLLLDAGAFFVNFEVGTDTFASAVAGGKLLGASRGGGQFSAVPEMRTIEVDGVKGAAKGLQVIDAWEIMITANVLEVSAEGLAQALTASDTDNTDAVYSKITAKNFVELADYIDNVTWVGKLSGSAEPVIIQVYNAINTNGLTLQTQDKDETVIAMEFKGHYDAADLDSPPFAIYYPKATVTKGSISGVISQGGSPAEDATVSVIVGSLAITTTTNASGEYTLSGVLAGTYTVTAYKGSATGAVTGIVVVADADTAGTNITIV